MANLSGLIAQNIIGAPVVTGDTAWVPTVTGFGTVVGLTAFYSIVGENIFGKVQFTAGTTTATLGSITLPNSWTTSDGLNSGVIQLVVGTWQRLVTTATAVKTGVIQTANAASNLLYFGKNDYTGTDNPNTHLNGSAVLGTGDAIEFNFRVRIDQLIGQGVTSLGLNGVLFSSNSNTSTSASDTTSFAYGPAGQPILAISSAGAWVKKRIQLPGSYIWQNLVRPRLMVSPDGKLWWPAVEQFPAAAVSGAYYGMEIQPVSGGSTNQLDIAFGGNGANSTQAWSAFSTWYWGVESAAPGQVTSYGLMQPGVANGLAAMAGYPPTQQKFLSGSGSYTTPTGVSWIRVRMVGGGGGGAGGGSSGGGAGGAGGATTFGTLTANGGAGGLFGSSAIPAGGTATITGGVGIGLSGSSGGGGSAAGSATSYGLGGTGGNSAFGGAGAGAISGTGSAAATNSGSGGGGGGSGNISSSTGGSGGASGGFVDVIISSPTTTYSYAVGAAGSSGATGTGTGNSPGGAGGAGLIIVEEHYI